MYNTVSDESIDLDGSVVFNAMLAEDCPYYMTVARDTTKESRETNSTITLGLTTCLNPLWAEHCFPKKHFNFTCISMWFPSESHAADIPISKATDASSILKGTTSYRLKKPASAMQPRTQRPLCSAETPTL